MELDRVAGQGEHGGEGDAGVNDQIRRAEAGGFVDDPGAAADLGGVVGWAHHDGALVGDDRLEPVGRGHLVGGQVEEDHDAEGGGDGAEQAEVESE